MNSDEPQIADDAASVEPTPTSRPRLAGPHDLARFLDRFQAIKEPPASPRQFSSEGRRVVVEGVWATHPGRSDDIAGPGR